MSLTRNTTRRLGALAVLAAIPTVNAAGQSIQVSYDTPTFDRWMYPFNPSPGERGAVSMFGTYDEPDFDNRDGQLIVGFDTSLDVSPGLGAASYDVINVRLILENNEDFAFIYDATQDPFGVFLAPDDPDYVADVDPGQPIELFGVGFRNGFDAFTFVEDSPYSPFGPFGEGTRNAYALGEDLDGVLADVGNSVDQRFDPVPWAIATIPGVAPGDFVPLGSEIVLDLNTADPLVQAYLAQSLNDGQIDLAVTALTIVEVMNGDFPSFHTKESTLVEFGLASAPRLEIEVEIVDAPCPSDIDASNAVDFNDLLTLLVSWGPCPDCPADLDGDEMVGFQDLLILLAAWGPCPG